MSEKKKAKKNANKAKKIEQKKPAENLVKLAPKLGISNIDDLVSQLLASLEKEDQIRVDIDAVEQVDTAAIQVLVGFSNSAVTAKRDIDWLGSSDVLVESSKILALGQYLDFGGEEVDEDDLCPVF